MSSEETKKQLSDTMEILEKFFYPKCKNSDSTVENLGHRGWYYMNEETANKLKRQIVKFKSRT